MYRFRQPARERGFSLIEVLVAVLVVSVGVLGVAGLQLVSLRNNTSALMRTQAVQYGYDIIDRARANPGQSYALALTSTPPAAPKDCGALDCTPTEMREHDLRSWVQGLAGLLPNIPGLPNGAAEIVETGGMMTVTVSWQDDRNSSVPLSMSVSTAR